MSCLTDKEESFESALQKLETVVHDLENGEIPLADLLDKYTNGVKLAKLCLDQLEHTEQVMDKILRENNGQIQETVLRIEGE